MRKRRRNSKKRERLLEWLKDEIASDNTEYLTEIVDFEDIDDVVYCAVARIDKRTLRRDVSAQVVFAHKILSEEEGPVVSECPETILRLLTPTKDESAQEWRRRCWRNVLTSAIVRKSHSSKYTIKRLFADLNRAHGRILASVFLWGEGVKTVDIEDASYSSGRLRLHIYDATRDRFPMSSIGDAHLHFGSCQTLAEMLQEDLDAGIGNEEVVLADFKESGAVIDYPIGESKLEDGTLIFTVVERSPLSQYWEHRLIALAQSLAKKTELIEKGISQVYGSGQLVPGAHKKKEPLATILNTLLVQVEGINAIKTEIITDVGLLQSDMRPPQNSNDQKKE